MTIMCVGPGFLPWAFLNYEIMTHYEKQKQLENLRALKKGAIVAGFSPAVAILNKQIRELEKKEADGRPEKPLNHS